MPSITGQVRNGTGKGVARKLRRESLLPAVIYGNGQPTRMITVNVKDFIKLMESEKGKLRTHPLTLNMEGGETMEVLLKEFQKDPVTDVPIHLDLVHFDPTRRIHIRLPIHVIGESESPGLKKGGILQVAMREADVHCRAGAIPDFLEAFINKMDVGESVHLRDIKLPPEVTIHGDPNATIAAIIGAKVEEVEVAAAPVKGKGAKGKAAPAKAAPAKAAPAAAAAPAPKAGGKK
ncbi:MAG: 50S ribosomal protein L25/general stress protein Ctc [Magnetococcales bacterium]|nr:50S ribosomal protein L25/general stress protein Ctc [Magnetococcales bacterium]